MKRHTVLFYVHDMEQDRDTILTSHFTVENNVELGIAVELEIESITQRHYTVAKVEVLGEKVKVTESCEVVAA
jgi:hypothetical protein